MPGRVSADTDKSCTSLFLLPVCSMSFAVKTSIMKSKSVNRRPMETSTFLRRSLIVQAELQRNSYPNAFTLASLFGCSRSTAMRTLDRLRYEFGVPIAYDDSKKGYYLTNTEFSFVSLPPGKDELTALIVLGELASMIDDTSLQDAAKSLWTRITNGRADLEHDLERIRDKFSIEARVVGKLSNIDVVRLLSFCHKGQLVLIRYRTPLHREEERRYAGMFERLHLADGILYAVFRSQLFRHWVLNVSFIVEVHEIAELPSLPHEDEVEPPAMLPLVEGVGLWPDRPPETIEIMISSPASHYYAAQLWHVDQEDSWDGDKLIRRFPGILSPELSRRVLSIGRFVVSVKPERVLESMWEDVAQLRSLYNRRGENQEA